MLQIEPGALGMLGRPFVTKLQHQPKSPLKEFCVNVGAGHVRPHRCYMAVREKNCKSQFSLSPLWVLGLDQVMRIGGKVPLCAVPSSRTQELNFK